MGAHPWSLLTGPRSSSCGDAARGSQAAPWEAAYIHGLQVVWLTSVSGPSAPCKLVPLPSNRYLCSEEPNFTSCSAQRPFHREAAIWSIIALCLGSSPSSGGKRRASSRRGAAQPRRTQPVCAHAEQRRDPPPSRQAGAFKRWSLRSSHCRVTAR